MKTANRSNLSLKPFFAWLVLGILGVTAAMVQPAQAQADRNTSDSLRNPADNQESVNLSDNVGGIDSLFQLYHRLNIGGGQSAGEFGQQQQRAIGDEAEAFRTRQRERLQQNGTPTEAPAGQQPVPQSDGLQQN
jgi:hypothetical protein